MRTARRRSTLAALVTGLIITLLPTAADACHDHDHDHWPSQPQPVELSLVYVYKKIDATAPAAWENSGEQTLIQVRDGHSWADSIDVALLPAGVCGDGWAVQEDLTRGLPKDRVPQVVDYQSWTGVLGWPPIVDARHGELSEYMDVPECTPVAPVVPPVVNPPVVNPPVVNPPVVTPPVVQPVTPPKTSPVVVEAAQAARPVLAAPAFTG